MLGILYIVSQYFILFTLFIYQNKKTGGKKLSCLLHLKIKIDIFFLSLTTTLNNIVEKFNRKNDT